MVRRLRLVLMMLLSTGPAMGQVTIPNTPAGQALTAWLDAFNSGDHLDRFAKHRANFERIANDKFARGGTEDDGSIAVLVGDVQA